MNLLMRPANRHIEFGQQAMSTKEIFGLKSPDENFQAQARHPPLFLEFSFLLSFKDLRKYLRSEEKSAFSIIMLAKLQKLIVIANVITLIIRFRCQY